MFRTLSMFFMDRINPFQVRGGADGDGRKLSGQRIRTLHEQRTLHADYLTDPSTFQKWIAEESRTLWKLVIQSMGENLKRKRGRVAVVHRDGSKIFK